jgi:AraC-like DNA-binding protein
MQSVPPNSDLPPTARLLPPRTSLASCIRAHIARDTTGIALLPEDERINRFPASHMCSFTWFSEGRCRLVAPEDIAMPDGRWLASAIVSGPHTRPSASFNPGPVRAFMTLLFPQALHAVTGLDVSTLTNRVVAMDEVLGPEWMALTQRVMQARDDEERMAFVEDFIEPHWRKARASGAVPGSAMGDWVHSVAVHAASSGFGRSVRKVERKIKSIVGQPLRGLKRIDRAEQSFLATRAQLIEGQPVSWADRAVEAGYSDQAHLCRETRALTGLTPTELARRAQDNEGYWVYRIWS